MTVIACPYCGAMMNLPLKFCVSCGRPTGTFGKFGGLKVITRGGTTKRLDDTMSGQAFKVAKKSYGFQRLMRQILWNTSYVLIAVLLYYFLVQFVVKEFPASLSNLLHKEEPSSAPPTDASVAPPPETPQTQPEPKPAQPTASAGKHHNTRRKHKTLH